MKKLTVIVSYLFLILALIVILSPKRYLYNFAQHTIAKEGIVISNELAKDKLISLEISNANIYVKDIFIGMLNKTTIYPFIVFNYVTCSGFKTSKEVNGLFSMSIDKATLFQWIGQPYKITIKAQGDFGSVSGFMNLKDRKIYLKIFPSKKFIVQIKKFGNGIKKNKEGFYTYEYSY